MHADPETVIHKSNNIRCRKAILEKILLRSTLVLFLEPRPVLSAVVFASVCNVSQGCRGRQLKELEGRIQTTVLEKLIFSFFHSETSRKQTSEV